MGGNINHNYKSVEVSIFYLFCQAYNPQFYSPRISFKPNLGVGL